MPAMVLIISATARLLGLHNLIPVPMLSMAICRLLLVPRLLSRRLSSLLKMQ